MMDSVTGRAEPFDPQTGEILPPQDKPQFAADGAIVPAAARSTGQFLDQLGEGSFSHETYAAIRDLGTKVREQAERMGKKVKGKITITLDVESEGEFFKITPDLKIKEPVAPRAPAAAWQDEDGNFTRFPPKQMQMFGQRPSGPIRMS